MRLQFKSKLGHRVEHKVRQVSRNVFETMSDSRLVIRLNHTGVYLTAGHSNYSATSFDWTQNQNAHHYHDPVLLGYGGEVRT